MLNKLKLSKHQFLLLMAVLPFNGFIYYGARLLTRGSIHYSLALNADFTIPYVSWTIMIYWGCFIFWTINYLICMKYDKGDGYRFILSHFIGEAICFLIFITLPTTMKRAEPGLSGLSNQLVQLTYSFDEANNLFPSIHCFVSWLCFIGVRNNKHIPCWYRFLSLMMAIAVCISTLTVKQHVIMDVFAGIVVAETAYLLSTLIQKPAKLKEV